MAQLRVLCVDRFTASPKRAQLFAELERLLDYLHTVGLICELWIDGSFVCDKEEPDDIDISVAYLAIDGDAIDPAVFNDLRAKLNGGFQFSPLLDTYLCPKFLRDDSRRPADMEDYWAGKWGKGRDDWLKGFVIIGVGS